jgi:hypothetical protein
MTIFVPYRVEDGQGNLVEEGVEEIDGPVVEPGPVQVTVDPAALSAAQDAVHAATTVAALRTAVLAALDLLNPDT